MNCYQQETRKLNENETNFTCRMLTYNPLGYIKSVSEEDYQFNLGHLIDRQALIGVLNPMLEMKSRKCFQYIPAIILLGASVLLIFMMVGSLSYNEYEKLSRIFYSILIVFFASLLILAKVWQNQALQYFDEVKRSLLFQEKHLAIGFGKNVQTSQCSSKFAYICITRNNIVNIEINV